MKNIRGITLIALVITIIILLILARYNSCCNGWRKWNNKKGNRYNGEDGKGTDKRRIRSKVGRIENRTDIKKEYS